MGGGGLISGIATAAKAIKPSIIIIGAEPHNADDAYRSKLTGQLCSNPPPVKTIADGLMTVLGRYTLPIVLERVEKIVTVSEEDIAKGVKLVYERLKIAIEPSAGVGVAAAMSTSVREGLDDSIRNIGVVLCGGNIDLVRLGQILEMATQGETTT